MPQPFAARPASPLRLAAALAVLWVLYSLPGTLTSGDWRLMTLPLEALVLAGLLMLAPLSIRWWLIWPVALVAGLAGLLQILDRAVVFGLGRRLNPVLDAGLLPNLLELLHGVIGLPLTVLAALAAAASVAGLFLLVGWSVASFARTRAPAAGLGMLLLALGLWQAPAVAAVPALVTAHTTPTISTIAAISLRMLGERRAFRADLAAHDFEALRPEAPLARLEGHDVLLVFLESYGRQALDQERYFDTVAPALERLEDAVAARGYAMKTGWSEAPTIGGESWLAHSTLLSGLWIDNQIRYRVLADEAPPMLSHTFAEAGWHNVLVAPAIERTWPEKAFMGFDAHYFANDLGYAGEPYNWVTMPDQYTLHAFEQLARTDEAPPLFAMLVLISGHAPWTPIPPVLDDWDAIGDGAIFARWADEGDPPEVVWLEPERVREHYTKAMDYVLRTLAGYVEEMRERPVLMIALGDHEAGGIIAGDAPPRDVPVHVIASDPALLEPFAAWDYRPGAFPDPDGKVPGMDRFPEFLLESYSGGNG